jgi:hypothetical protein
MDWYKKKQFEAEKRLEVIQLKVLCDYVIILLF